MKHLIWLASYPKSGNTWFRILLDSILLHEGGPVDINRVKTASLKIIERQQFDEFLEFDSGELTMQETQSFKRKYYLEYGHKATESTFIKTHEANITVDDHERLIPEQVTKLCIYIVRNPLDIVCSLANHYIVSTDEAIKIMGDSSYTFFRHEKGITSNIPEMIGDWSMHVNSWLNTGKLPVILIKYEDLLSKPIQTLGMVMQKLDQPVSDLILQRAVNNHSFEKLAHQESKHGFREKVVASYAFFRKGKADSWKEELTQGQISRMIESHHQVMNNLGYSTHINKQ
ncbi:MAG: sulfotransferase domain-containing protein [Roseivirga sp.]|nr:sulfotransferase domain-containing protein [Roseivirga sp.]